MKFDRLRLSGFKSFVDPVDLDILPGITGIVGPNGCGKSNLLEALRWVMGEKPLINPCAGRAWKMSFSPEPMRAPRAIMPKCSSSSTIARAAHRLNIMTATSWKWCAALSARQARLIASMAAMCAPRCAIAVCRCLQRRALQCAGQAGANRRNHQCQAGSAAANLEEAAGISGLHSRRHEAELRLRGAESNLEKLDDTLSGFETQYRQLKRQALQASRYRNISGQIREVEALALHLRWQEAEAKLAETETALIEARQSVAQAGSAAMQASTQQSELQAKLPELRMAETEKAAALRRIKLEQDGLEAEARRAQEMAMRLAEQLATIEQDMARGREALADAGQQQERLKAEEAELRAGIAADESAAENAAAAEVAANVEKLQAAEAVLDASNRYLAEYSAQKQALQAGVEANQARREKLQAEQAKLAEQRAARLKMKLPPILIWRHGAARW